jgi:hypothetical protein
MGWRKTAARSELTHNEPIQVEVPWATHGQDSEARPCDFLLFFAYAGTHEPQGLHDVLPALRLAGSIPGGGLSNLVRKEISYAKPINATGRTPLPKRFVFTDSEKITELAKRGEAWGDSESRQMLEMAIEQGRGGCYLNLTPAQYRALRS